MLRACLMLAFLPLLTTAAPAAAPLPHNLLANPGFEDARGGVTAGWDTTDAGMPTVFLGRDTLERHGGAASVYVANVSTAVPMWHNWSQILLIGPEMQGKDLTLTVWTRSNGLSGRGYILLQCYKDTLTHYAKTYDIPREEAEMRLGIFKTFDPSVSLNWHRIYFSDENTEWVKREIRAYVPKRTNVAIVRLGIFGTGQVYFDDASLVAVPAAPAPPIPLHKNLLADASFEGEGNHWEYSMPPYTGIRVERDTTQGHTGRASIRYSEGASGMINTRSGVGQVFNNRNLGGKRFRFGGWCKLDSLQGIAYLRPYYHTPDTVFQGPIRGRFSFTQDWTYTGGEFETPPGTVEIWLWAVYNVPAKGKVWWDDLVLECLGPVQPSKPAPGRRPAPRPKSR